MMLSYLDWIFIVKEENNITISTLIEYFFFGCWELPWGNATPNFNNLRHSYRNDNIIQNNLSILQEHTSPIGITFSQRSINFTLKLKIVRMYWSKSTCIFEQLFWKHHHVPLQKCFLPNGKEFYYYQISKLCSKYWIDFLLYAWLFLIKI